MGKHLGKVFRIVLKNDKVAFGKVVGKYLFAFYHIPRLSEDHLLSSLENEKPLFHLHVYATVFKHSKWEEVAKVPVSETEKSAVHKFFRQDISNFNICWHIDPFTGEKIEVLPSDCMGVEREAVWSYDHIEQRLLDFTENRENMMEKRMRVKLQ